MYGIYQPVAKKYTENEFSEYIDVPSVRYRHQLKEICQQLAQGTEIKYFYLVLSTKIASTLCLGNKPDWSLTYKKYGLSRLDAALNPPEGVPYFLTESLKKDALSELFYQWLEAYGIYEIYSIVRYSEDVKAIAIAHADSVIVKPQSFFESTQHVFENFTVDFIDAAMDIIKACSPLLAQTKFIKDRDYRKEIVQGRIILPNVPSLSLRESQILMCAFNGYTAKEIAKILNLEYRTIEKYMAHAKKKLSAKNTTHAVKRAIELGIIR